MNKMAAASTTDTTRQNLSIRELLPSEASLIVNYFHSCSSELLCKMGCAESKMPTVEKWQQMIEQDFERPLAERQLYYLLWLLDGIPIGHSNMNEIELGVRANMHLHLWKPEFRQKGLGQCFVQQCVDQYFSKFDIQTLYCEPRAENPGPNKVMERLGFQLECTHTNRIPNVKCYAQNTNEWRLTRAEWEKIMQREDDEPTK